MQTRNKFLDDMSQLFTNALGVAQGARTEAETAMRGMIDRWLAERDLATREEIDALREMVLKSRAETEALAARVAALEAAASPAAPAAPKRARSAAPKG
jgi:BMFP domain-containing protein YqiC